MCAEGKIKSVTKCGNMWVIPEITEKPLVLRMKTGKYINK